MSDEIFNFFATLKITAQPALSSILVPVIQLLPIRREDGNGITAEFFGRDDDIENNDEELIIRCEIDGSNFWENNIEKEYEIKIKEYFNLLQNVIGVHGN